MALERFYLFTTRIVSTNLGMTGREAGSFHTRAIAQKGGGRYKSPCVDI